MNSDYTKIECHIDGYNFTKISDVDSIVAQWKKDVGGNLYDLQLSISNLPMVESVVVTNENATRLHIQIKEKRPYVAYLFGESIIYVDRHFEIIPSEVAHEIANVPVVRIKNSSSISNAEKQRKMKYGLRIVNMLSKYGVYELVSDVVINERTSILALSGTSSVLLVSEENLERGIQMFKNFADVNNANHRICDVNYIDARYKSQLAVAVSESKHVDTANNPILCLNAITE